MSAASRLVQLIRGPGSCRSRQRAEAGCPATCHDCLTTSPKFEGTHRAAPTQPTQAASGVAVGAGPGQVEAAETRDRVAARRGGRAPAELLDQSWCSWIEPQPKCSLAAGLMPMRC